MSGREYESINGHEEITPGVFSLLLYLCLLVCFSAEKVFAEDLQHLIVRAKAGDCIAQTALAEAYETGNGAPIDYQLAFHWYQKAAASGHAKAQRPLGVLYEKGRGVDKDAGKAAEWYRKAADQGIARAQVNLGQLYEMGEGVERDYGQAVSWYRKAADSGYVRGVAHLGLMYEQGLGVKKDLAVARSHYERAVTAGYPKAKIYLARLEKDGESLAKPSPGQRISKEQPRPEVSPPITDGASIPQGEKHFYLGNQHAKAGRFDLAIVEYGKALEIEPENVNTLENMAISQKKKGNLLDAIATMDRLLALAPNDPDRRMVLAIMLIDHGDYDQALTQLKMGISLNPTLPGLYNEMAVAYGGLADYGKALKSAQVAQALGYDAQALIADLQQMAPGLELDNTQSDSEGYYLRQLVVETSAQAESSLKALQNGKDFGTLVAERAIPQFRKDGGFFSYYRHGEINSEIKPEISDIIEKLPPFAFSPVIKTDEGYRIFQKVVVSSDILNYPSVKNNQ